MLLYQLPHLEEALVLRRPSSSIKSPYVADLSLQTTGENVLAHTVSLGCCGLVEREASVLVAPILSTTTSNNKTKTKCSHRVYLSIVREKGIDTLIGVHPQLAEHLVESAIRKNAFQALRHVQSLRREFTVYVEGKVDSRFDFTGIDSDGVPFILEVKNVPLADYEDISAKDKRLLPPSSWSDRPHASKVAYFPDGYRKHHNDPVSPRALKHLKELTLIKRESRTRCVMCYVIQRTDVERFQPSVVDPLYRDAFREAVQSGVEIIPFVVRWTREGNAYFVCDDLPVSWS